MPKSKLKSHHNGHALTRGKGSIYQRNILKREEERELNRETHEPPQEAMNTPPPSP